MYQHKSRLSLDDSVMDAMLKMADGNPGAINVLSYVLRKAAEIDPDDAFGALGTIMALDDMGIYGSEIWMLFKDVCGQDLVKMLGVMRASQLGFIPQSDLLEAIRERKALPVNELVGKVKDRLPRFGQVCI